MTLFAAWATLTTPLDTVIDQEERLRTTGMQVESERAARGVADAALRQAEQAMAEVRWRKFPATGITTYSLSGVEFPAADSGGTSSTTAC